jgi:hypothetical protein
MKINNAIIVRSGALSAISDIPGTVLVVDSFGVKLECETHEANICRPDAGEFNIETVAFRDDRHGGIFQVVRVSPGGPWTASWCPTTLEIEVLGPAPTNPGSP